MNEHGTSAGNTGENETSRTAQPPNAANLNPYPGWSNGSDSSLIPPRGGRQQGGAGIRPLYLIIIIVLLALILAVNAVSLTSQFIGTGRMTSGGTGFPQGTMQELPFSSDSSSTRSNP